jgi:hypothetical protein
MSAMTQNSVRRIEDLYLPEDYLIVRHDNRWWTYSTRLACEIDRIHATFAKKLLKSGYIEFVANQAFMRRTFYKKAKPVT